MKKKKYKVVKAQAGIPNQPVSSIPLQQANPQNLFSQKKTPSFPTTLSFEEETGAYDFNPYVKIFNMLAQLVTGAANTASNVAGDREAQKQYLAAIQSPSYSVNEEGLNNLPIYTKQGGKVPEYPYGGGPLTSEGAKEILRHGEIHGKKLTSKQKRYFGFIAGGGKPKKEHGGCAECMDDDEIEMMMKDGGKNWIPNNLKKGRCKDPGSPECPKGSPQYNLAMTFKKHHGFHKAEMGIEETEGVGENDSPTVEAEEGEVFTTQDGQIQKVQEGAGTHEEGGVLLNNVDRVLEDTSDKRKDKVSKALKVSPMMAKLLGGVDTGTAMSHSKLMEKSKETHTKKLDKIQSKLSKNVDSIKHSANNVYAQNSMDINLMGISDMPTEGELFDRIFDHQEFIKAALGIDQVKARCGGKYKLMKAQTGHYDVRKPYQKTDKFNPKDWVWDSNKGMWLHTPTGSRSTSLPTSKPFNRTMPEVTVSDFPNSVTPSLTSIDPTKTYEDINLSGLANAFNMGNKTASGNTSTNTGSSNNRFFEPLNWFDVAGPLGGLLSGTQRTPVKYNPVELNQIRLRKQNPLPELQNAQADFNAVLKTLPPTGVGQANAANLFAKKYALDNQVLGQFENINTQIQNQETQYNAGIRDRQSLANQQAREAFEAKFLGSKEAQRQQILTSLDELYQRLALNKKLNREGNLLMQLFPAFNQRGEYSGYKYQFRNPLTQPQKTS